MRMPGPFCLRKIPSTLLVCNLFRQVPPFPLIPSSIPWSRLQAKSFWQYLFAYKLHEMLKVAEVEVACAQPPWLEVHKTRFGKSQPE